MLLERLLPHSAPNFLHFPGHHKSLCCCTSVTVPLCLTSHMMLGERLSVRLPMSMLAVQGQAVPTPGAAPASGFRCLPTSLVLPGPPQLPGPPPLLKDLPEPRAEPAAAAQMPEAEPAAAAQEPEAEPLPPLPPDLPAEVLSPLTRHSMAEPLQCSQNQQDVHCSCTCKCVTCCGSISSHRSRLPCSGERAGMQSRGARGTEKA